MEKISIKQIIKKTFIIWGVSIILGSLLLAIYFSIDDKTVEHSFSFFELLYIISALSAMLSLPALFMLFFALLLIYRRTKTKRFRFWTLLFLGITISCITLFIISYLEDGEFLVIGSVYSLIAIITAMIVCRKK